MPDSHAGFWRAITTARRSRSATTSGRPAHRKRTTRLVREKLADGDRLFALLGELRPVGAHAFFVVEPAPRMGDRQRHRGQALGGRVDHDHGVFSQGSPVALSRSRPTGRRPSRLGGTQQAPPSSCRRKKFSANASRTASNPRSHTPRYGCVAMPPWAESLSGYADAPDSGVTQPLAHPRFLDMRRQPNVAGRIVASVAPLSRRFCVIGRFCLNE